mmetsp:Transcript_86431/g.129610  ORF Transcript_86431/g.129610 Transcript_86431/m.129610 type:complete len:345 (+) Transcript_86431:45-1079(+)
MLVHLFGLFHVLDEVKDTVGVSGLVVIPRNKFDEVVSKGNSGLLVEDRRVRVRDEVGGNNIFIGVSKNSSHRTLGGGLDGGADGLVRGTLLQSASQVNNGNVDGRDTEGHSGELSIQFRNDLSDGLGGSGGRRNDIVASGTSSAPVLLRRSVNGLLRGGDSVDSGHQTLLKSEFVVDNLGDRSQTVGGTGCVGNNIHGRIVFLLVHTHHEHGGIRGGSRDDDLLGSTGQVGRCLFGGSENTSGFDDVIGTGRSPVNFRGVKFSEDLDGLSVNADGVCLLVVSDLLSCPSVGRIVLVHVLHVFHRDEGIVDGHNVDIGSVCGSAHHKATDAAKSIDTDVDRSRHC